MRDNLTLRIKRTYFDKILSGEKDTEYRDYKDYYIRLLSVKPKCLTLHYQGDRKLKAKVVYIRKIKTPKKLKDSGIPFGDYVFAIKLKEPRLV